MKKEQDQFCKGKPHNMERFMEICLLLLLSQENSHGYTLAEKLIYFGFSKEELNLGSLYRTLRKMEKSNYVASNWQKGGPGPKKRVYQITETGKDMLDQWIQILKNRKKRIEKLISSYDLLKNKFTEEEK
ncbi:MAG: helix-turn-helix transcriptional regulator [Atribacterota bacterium]|nr:helix-turn-helix transcriptional regulator [Atribacterota bacterium]